MSNPESPLGQEIPPARQETASIGELFGRLTEQLSRLVRAEIDLAKKEVIQQVTKFGISAALIVVGGVLALYGLGVLIHSAVLGLTNVFAPWLAALSVGALIMVIAGLLAFIGIKRIKAWAGPKPEAAIKSVKETVDAVKEGLSS